MSVKKIKRLSKIAKEFNVGISTIVDFLKRKGFDVGSSPNSKVTTECYDILSKEYKSDLQLKLEQKKIARRTRKAREEVKIIENKKLEKSKKDDEKTILKTKKTVAAKEKSKILTDIKKSNVDIEKNQLKEEEPTINKKEVEQTEKKIENKEPEIQKVEIKEPENPPIENTTPESDTIEPEVKNIDTVVSEISAETEDNVTDEQTPEETEKDTEKVGDKEKLQEKSNDTEEELSQSPKETVKKIKETTNNKEKPSKSKKTRTKKDEKSKKPSDNELKVIGKIDLSSINQRTRPKRKTKEEKKDERIKKEREKRLLREKEKQARLKAKDDKQSSNNTDSESKTSNKKGEDFLKTKFEKLSGPTVLGKIELPGDKKESTSDKKKHHRKKRRKRIPKEAVNLETKNTQSRDKNKQRNKRNFKKAKKQEIDDVEVKKQIKETLAKLTAPKGKNKGSKYRRDKREEIRSRLQDEHFEQEKEKRIIKVTEFVTANELASMMDVDVNKVITNCMTLGLLVSINTRLDAETIALLVEDFGYQVEFVSVELQEAIAEEEDKEEDLIPRFPIVTVMGHVDHGKTSLLDYIRNTNIIAGESGGITQHIGAYSVTFEEDKHITFLDTPGHEAFTSMRSRGAQVTDLAIIVVAADDKVMPTTIEAINHAKAADVPIIFAINKIDRPNANPENIKRELADLDYLVEEWGGKYQSKDISAKFGNNVDELMEEVFLAAEMLELKANPNKRAVGTVIESSLDKGRGYVATVLVRGGTLHVGDSIVAGTAYGKVKAIYNERNKRIKSLGPAQPGMILGLNGAPAAGDQINVMNSDREARDIAVKREKLQREQSFRSQKHITLEEIGRRLAIGNFQELNIIIKADVDGSVEALHESLRKLSTEQIQVKIIHKAVGQIVASDVMLANASDAIIIGFQVRPELGARKLAEQEGIEIRLYSIIYDAINEVKDSIAGMLAPVTKEVINAVVEVKDIFKISKVGTIAGCIVKDGKITRNAKVRIIREGIVIYTSTLGSLKRFKDDAKEVNKGLECGLNIDKFNDIKIGDMIEAFEIVEVER